jgi:hypothetical protein
MANNDLIKKKSVSLTEATHARLMAVVEFLQVHCAENTTANQAIEELLNIWEDGSKTEPQAKHPPLIEQIFFPNASE